GGRELARPGRDRVEAADLDPAGDLAAVEVRDETAGRAQESRLAAARAAGEDDELAGADPQRDGGEGGAVAVRVCGADGLEREGGGGGGGGGEVSHGAGGPGG